MPRDGRFSTIFYTFRTAMFSSLIDRQAKLSETIDYPVIFPRKKETHRHLQIQRTAPWVKKVIVIGCRGNFTGTHLFQV